MANNFDHYQNGRRDSKREYLRYALSSLKSAHRLLRARKHLPHSLGNDQIKIYLRGQISAFRAVSSYIISNTKKTRNYRDVS